MIAVYERVYVGGMEVCAHGADGRAHVHACKTPCHQYAVGYRGSLANSHPNYLALRRAEHLYLNLIDPPAPLFKLESFRVFRTFAAEQWRAGRDLVIHCNRGESRAPSLALLFLAKDLAVVPVDTFASAASGFTARYSRYSPGVGIVAFLRDNWALL